MFDQAPDRFRAGIQSVFLRPFVQANTHIGAEANRRHGASPRRRPAGLFLWIFDLRGIGSHRKKVISISKRHRVAARYRSMYIGAARCHYILNVSSAGPGTLAGLRAGDSRQRVAAFPSPGPWLLPWFCSAVRRLSPSRVAMGVVMGHPVIMGRRPVTADPIRRI